MSTALRAALAAACLAALTQAHAAELRVGGRMHVDYAAYRADVRQLDDAFLLRRAKLDVEGKLTDDWSFEAAYDFAAVYSVTDTGTRKEGAFKEGFDGVSLQYDGWKAADLEFGQFKVPFGLEELNSSNNITFIERALVSDAFAPSRRIGVGASRNRQRYTLSAMGFGSSIDARDKGHGAAVRATYTPINTGQGGALVHLGLAVSLEHPSDDVKFNARPESRALDVRFLNTGNLDNIDRIDRLGLEAGANAGPASLQAEWMRAAIKRDHGDPDAQLQGWYVMGSWVLTGQSRQYRHGRFRSVSVQPSAGAWELAARFSHLDLDDGGVRGGEEDNITLGLNYYLNDRVRIMLNHIDVHSERRGRKDNPQILLLRTQLSF
ncbi:OprO/OprP family phosphate-selective porin [Xanthomonas vesicatoria]|uniref:Porin n=1 Tax=Xanthomonas vesicatoria TaxID=56460 RepID=A0AAJ0J0B5_9XANT|nr:OprO/OprP family phosphate-selective porin [Xanthomonas vesicatoria]APO94431.1 porin [Xanthomonas vesicatoria]KHM95042.1 porin [Xanthomonas vesicatoria]KHM96548.1 porin [Xanthomonas vesicatoria]KTF32318.1 porin [Xanthomonas vesicatoria]MCC8556532.1 OprO/OprP family phosphate-selective porin [Xanthomonas vesicatoria]